jgi:1-(5-phosphoribosyl)-5-[(5-phosphoribosylamino)methylideneamino] imidazole-4-carboxamide isomerase/N-(5'phosphoribosyl)anthranilate isomerase
MTGAPSRPAPLTLLPAVDVSGGRAVQLVQGEASRETAYGDPVEAARRWQQAGAEWIHMVDLDAAFGRGSNAAVLAEMISQVDISVELSGGIRNDDALAAALGTGAQRVILGTAALENPDWVRTVIGKHGDRVAVGLDARGDRLAARGWTTDGGDLMDTLARLDADGCARYIVTDVAKDGMLHGPNLDLLKRVCAATTRPVIASGGVSSIADLQAIAGLRPDGVEGAIIGTALYEGKFTLPAALTALTALTAEATP